MDLPFYHFTKAEASNLQFGMPLGFAKAHRGHHINSHINRKKSFYLGVGELPNIWGFSYIISAVDEVINFKFSVHLKFSKVYNIKHTKRKSGRGSMLGVFPKIYWFSLLVLQWMKLAYIHCESKKHATILLSVTSPDVDRFSKFFH